MNPQEQISPSPNDRRSRARTARTEAARKRREEKAAARKFSGARREASRGAPEPTLGHEINETDQNASNLRDDNNGRADAEPAGPPTAGFYANDRHTAVTAADNSQSDRGQSDRGQPAFDVPRLVDSDADSSPPDDTGESGHDATGGAGGAERGPGISDRDSSESFSARLAAASQAAQERVAQVRAEAQQQAHDAAQQRTRAEEILETARIEADQLLKSAQADR